MRKSKKLTMSKDKGHKQHEVDFSNLPDNVLHRILSLLPTKEAVKISILSIKWNNHWTFISNIDIDDDLLFARLKANHWRVQPDMIPFKNFAERVLRLRDPSNIEKFRLSCIVFDDIFQIHSWISNAIKHNVQDLDLYFAKLDPSVIPRSMFEGTSLVSLKIKIASVIQLPSHVSFPCLKTLHLSGVHITSDDFTEKFFSGCPVLEELVLLRCFFFNNLNNVVISSSTLMILAIEDMSRGGPFQDYSGCKITIDAANLACFEYVGYLLNGIFLNNAPSLEEAFVNISDCGERLYEVACQANDLLDQLQNVVSLTLSNRTMETLLYAGGVRCSVFRNLTDLMLTMEVGMNRTFRLLMRILSFCPVLQYICFSEGFMRNMHLGEKNSVWSSIPTCMSNSIKIVTLKNFHGYTSELCFLKRVLTTACALEKINISWSEAYVRDLKRKIKVQKDLEKIERKATTCVINFS